MVARSSVSAGARASARAWQSEHVPLNTLRAPFSFLDPGDQALLQRIGSLVVNSHGIKTIQNVLSCFYFLFFCIFTTELAFSGERTGYHGISRSKIETAQSALLPAVELLGQIFFLCHLNSKRNDSMRRHGTEIPLETSKNFAQRLQDLQRTGYTGLGCFFIWLL